MFAVIRLHPESFAMWLRLQTEIRFFYDDTKKPCRPSHVLYTVIFQRASELKLARTTYLVYNNTPYHVRGWEVVHNKILEDFRDTINKENVAEAAIQVWQPLICEVYPDAKLKSENCAIFARATPAAASAPVSAASL